METSKLLQSDMATLWNKVRRHRCWRWQPASQAVGGRARLRATVLSPRFLGWMVVPQHPIWPYYPKKIVADLANVVGLWQWCICKGNSTDFWVLFVFRAPTTAFAMHDMSCFKGWWLPLEIGSLFTFDSHTFGKVLEYLWTTHRSNHSGSWSDGGFCHVAINSGLKLKQCGVWSSPGRGPAPSLCLY